jgi:hypothetical protein
MHNPALSRAKTGGPVPGSPTATKKREKKVSSRQAV